MQLGKNTYDIALALDAIEAFFDQRVDAFCLVTSDSDFVHLCKKLRERGAMVYIVGEAKTPAALRNTCDQFFVWTKQEKVLSKEADSNITSKQASTKPRVPDIVFEAVETLATDTDDGRVGLGALGSYLKRRDPSFTPKSFGFSSWSVMVESDKRLSVSRLSSSIFVSLHTDSLSKRSVIENGGS
jgi:NYN domain/OST-HTH/LOTUS domain